ncbi:MAG: response regulator [Syntrophobacteraceae bacterium]
MPTFTYPYDLSSMKGQTEMLHILLVTPRLQELASFTRALASDPGVKIESVASGAAALDVVCATPPHLAVIDVDLPDDPPMGLVQRMLTVNAMVNTAVVSSLSEDEFHEASEGLGILGRLPLDPGINDAEALLIKLRRLMGLVS